MSSVSGILLAGGRGERFRGDKLGARLRGIPLLAWATALLGGVADDVVIVTRHLQETRGRWRFVRDEVAERGPLAGLLTGLRQIRHERALVLPVDMPVVPSDFLIYLRDLGAAADIVVPQWGPLEPLVAVYARACLPDLEAALARGQDSPGQFIRDSGRTVRYVVAEEIARFGDPRRMFFNVNQPEDLPVAESLLAAAAAPAGGE